MHRLTAVAALVLVAALSSVAPAAAHKADPHYLTRVDSVTPGTAGVSVEVLNRSDQLELHNTSGKTVVIGGYNNDEYARVAADGTVSVNTQSPAYYLNQDRYGDVDVPDGIDGRAPPQWKVIDKTSRFAWHDHRMHWMSKTPPKSIKDESVRTKIFNWKVPVSIEGADGAIAGTLFWTPEPGVSMGFIVIGSVLVLALCAGAIVVRRRRDHAAPQEGEAKEVW